MKIGSKELLEKVKQPRQLEMFTWQETPIAKHFMDYIDVIHKQVEQSMQFYLEGMLLHPAGTRLPQPEFGTPLVDTLKGEKKDYEANVMEFVKRNPQWKPDWDENYFDKTTRIAASDYYNSMGTLDEDETRL